MEHPRRGSTDRGWPGCPQLGTSPKACVSNADSPWSGKHPRTCGSAGGRSLCRRRAVAVGAGHGVPPRTHWGNPLCIHRGPTRALAANTARESNGVGENAGGPSTTTQGVNPASRTGRRPTRSYPCGNGVWRRGCTGIGLPSPSAATAWERWQGQLSFSPTGNTAPAHHRGVGPGCGTQQGGVQGGPGNWSGTFLWGSGYYSCTSSGAPPATMQSDLRSAARWGWPTRDTGPCTGASKSSECDPAMADTCYPVEHSGAAPVSFCWCLSLALTLSATAEPPAEPFAVALAPTASASCAPTARENQWQGQSWAWQGCRQSHGNTRKGGTHRNTRRGGRPGGRIGQCSQRAAQSGAVDRASSSFPWPGRTKLFPGQRGSAAGGLQDSAIDPRQPRQKRRRGRLAGLTWLAQRLGRWWCWEDTRTIQR